MTSKFIATALGVVIFFALLGVAKGADRIPVYSPGPNHASPDVVSCMAAISALNDLQGAHGVGKIRVALRHVINRSC